MSILSERKMQTGRGRGRVEAGNIGQEPIFDKIRALSILLKCWILESRQS